MEPTVEDIVASHPHVTAEDIAMFKAAGAGVFVGEDGRSINLRWSRLKPRLVFDALLPTEGIETYWFSEEHGVHDEREVGYDGSVIESVLRIKADRKV
jgi:hypothetical protein